MTSMLTHPALSCHLYKGVVGIVHFHWIFISHSKNDAIEKLHKVDIVVGVPSLPFVNYNCNQQQTYQWSHETIPTFKEKASLLLVEKSYLQHETHSLTQAHFVGFDCACYLHQPNIAIAHNKPIEIYPSLFRASFKDQSHQYALTICINNHHALISHKIIQTSEKIFPKLFWKDQPISWFLSYWEKEWSEIWSILINAAFVLLIHHQGLRWNRRPQSKLRIFNQTYFATITHPLIWSF